MPRFQHLPEHLLSVFFTAVGAKCFIVVQPAKDDDFSFAIKPKKYSVLAAEFSSSPTTVLWTKGVAKQVAR